MKRFEAYIGNQWHAFEASDKVTISKKANVVTVIVEDVVANEIPIGRLKTVFNLAVIPAYSFA